MKKRRDFLKLLPYLTAGAFLYPTSKFIFFIPKKRDKFWLSLSNIKNGITKIKKHNLFIYKDADDYRVFDAHCTHMGCILNYFEEKKRFICPCHHSNFTKDGRVVKGPAKRDLDTIPFKIEKNKIIIG